MAESHLAGLLVRLRRRVMSIGLASAAGWSLAAMVGLMLLAGWLDLIVELPPALRILSVVAACGAGAAWLIAAWRSVARLATPFGIARRIDAASGSGGRVLSAVDLMLAPESPTPLTAGLACMAIADATALAGRVPAPAAAPVRPLARPWTVLPALLALVAILAAALPRMAWTQWLRFTDPFGDHPPYSPLVLTVDPGNILVTYGDGVDIRAGVEGGLVDRVELAIRGRGDSAPQILPMFREPGGLWRTTLAGVTDPGEYWIRARSARTRRYTIEVITVPKLEAVRFRITPPAYTQQMPYEGPLPQTGIAGLPGTLVEMWATSNRPLSGGVLHVRIGDPTQVHALRPVDGETHQVSGSFQIRQGGEIRLRVTDVAGQPSKDEFAASVTVLADQRPFVRILEPLADSFATPDVALPVRVAAEDDFGVSGVQLFRNLNDSRPLPRDLLSTPPIVTRAQPADALPLDTYGLRPGDVIKLFARVEDNDPAGAKGAESAVVQIRIISQQDFERLIRARQGMEVLLSKHEQATRRLENLLTQLEELQKELESMPADSELARQQLSRIEDLAARMQQEAEEISKAADLELPYDVDRAMTAELRKLAAQLQQASGRVGQLAAGRPAQARPTAEQLEQIRRQLAQQRRQFEENVISPLNHLAAVVPLMEDAARFTELYLRQRDLAERLASLQGRDGEDDPQLKARMRDLETEQARLREDLAALLADIGNHATALPADEQLSELRTQALEFVKAVRASGADAAMTEAERGLSEFSGTRGAEHSRRAADILEKFISKCKGMSGQGNQCLAFNPSLSSCLGNSVEQLLADAGLGEMGVGAGGGYSARRSSMNNVGLYGALPAMGPAGQRGGASDAVAAAGGASADDGEFGYESRGIEAAIRMRAAGAAEATVPPRYRERVGAYFRRVAEELELPERR